MGLVFTKLYGQHVLVWYTSWKFHSTVKTEKGKFVIYEKAEGQEICQHWIEWCWGQVHCGVCCYFHYILGTKILGNTQWIGLPSFNDTDRSIHFSFLRIIRVNLHQGLSFINNGRAKVSSGRERGRQTAHDLWGGLRVTHWFHFAGSDFWNITK